MSAYRFEPGTYMPGGSEMTDFNIWAWNSRVFPGIDPMVARIGERVRIRMANLTMTNHPVHLHGHHFSVTGTDGGWVPQMARWPESTTDVPVGVTRTIEFDAATAPRRRWSTSRFSLRLRSRWSRIRSSASALSCGSA
ncbi:hypothetical protein D1O30_04825 [Methylocystis hirsuta]|uniref:Plastocyanin-like domain-containing protein n=1 Tax=Methylocystis hirsuta TaxID=369798 RepID=A0A3M9XTC7_9HYPH|nr:hypothetical protein D1O30_04825 [Methylocystis hirsuta]